MMLQNQLENHLTAYRSQVLGTNFPFMKMVKNLVVAANKIIIDLHFNVPILHLKQELLNELTSYLTPLLGNQPLTINVTMAIDAHTGNQMLPALSEIKNVIAIASGKGGVGKSLIANQLAFAFQHIGGKVGLLDADIYGPSQPTMLGTEKSKPKIENGILHPLTVHGLQTMSIGYLVADTAPLVWRGPMISKAMQQMLYDTRWQGLDYLIIDLPPGTGDIQLTLCQKIPVSGALIVTTPQDLALIDVKRACEMFKKLNIPMLGVVENMSSHHCQQCGHETHLFGQGGAQKLADQYQLDVLAHLPLAETLGAMTDSAQSFMTNHPYQGLFSELAFRIAFKLSLQHKDYSGKFPKIMVEKQRNV